jgi:hypothetical protein
MFDHSTRDFYFCILVFEAEGLGYQHRFLHCHESTTRIDNQGGGLLDECRSVGASAGYRQWNRKQNSLAPSLIRERHSA